MSKTGAKELTETEYQWLLANAALQSDFFHLGGASGADSAGDLAGFACLAETEYQQTPKANALLLRPSKALRALNKLMTTIK